MSPGPQLIVMGVAGAGKTTVGRALADRLALPYADGDAFHSPASVAKMASGTPLDDDDRRPWLGAIGAWLAAHPDGAVVSCSALARRYRDLLRAAAPRVGFVHLDGAPALLADRLAARSGHFMPAALLASQLAALEPLAADEAGVAVPIDGPPEAVLGRAIAALPEVRRG